MIASMKAGLTPFDPSDPSGTYLLPNALYVPDSLHMVFGALEVGVKTAGRYWETLEPDMKSISQFLGDASLKLRWSATCSLTRIEKALVAGYVGKHADWKWEYLHKYLGNLRPILPILMRTFDRKKV